jgi:arginyl-tRNA synthetase
MISPAAVKVAETIANVLDGLGLQRSSIELEALFEKPKGSKNGDFALPCFQFAKALGKAPPAIAEDVHAALTQQTELLQSAGVAKFLTAGPYINFSLNRAMLAASVFPRIFAGSHFAQRAKKHEKVMVEYSQPNTHKAFHVGHLRNVAIGDSVRRLLEWNGHEVVPVNYIGDEGAHVAKALWHLRTQFSPTGQKIPADHQGEFLGEQYAKGTEMQSLDAYTNVAKPGVKAALVKSTKKHPEAGFVDAKGRKPCEKWQVVTLEMPNDTEGSMKTYTVLTGAQGFAEGDLVAYASIGVKVDNKVLAAVDKKGVQSEGMILSEKEVGLTDDNDTVAVLPKNSPSTGKCTQVGDSLVEIYRHKFGDAAKPYALPHDVAVLETFFERKAECSKILQSIEAGPGNEIYEQWEATKKWSMEEFHRIYKWVDARFDDWFFESEYGESSKALIREFMVPNLKDQQRGKGAPAFVESDGAVGADLSQWKLGFCLLIKSDGTALYATRDLALAQKKFEKYGIEKSIYVVDGAQTLHFQQVFKCLELMGYEQAKKCKHLAYAQVVLPDGKMSSRKGNVILFSHLEEKLTTKINEEFLDKFKDEWAAEEIARAAHYIALASMRYGMLNQDMGSQITFDLDAWCSAKGNTGPYSMYAYARTRSILRGYKKSLSHDDAACLAFVDHLLGESDTSIDFEAQKFDFSLLSHEFEHELIGLLSDYPTLMEQAASATAPVEVYRFAYSLSKSFSQWFQTKECSLLHADSSGLQRARALLTDAVGRTLKHALGLIGIQVLEKM